MSLQPRHLDITVMPRACQHARYSASPRQLKEAVTPVHPAPPWIASVNAVEVTLYAAAHPRSSPKIRNNCYFANSSCF
ncbi:hypothetical protein SESBI_24006 [Sesbania bispinosa]|nr:hypothetical protein SESBI_24006 [Sesbania bispinosa]